MAREWSVLEKMVLKMEVHGDIHVQLSRHRSDARLNGRNSLMVDVVIGEDILHDAVDDRNIGNVVGKG